jgi:hypothetical protein
VPCGGRGVGDNVIVIQRAAIVLVVAALLGGCARNEYGIPLKKKPDLSTVQPGTPVNKVRGLKKPVKKEVLTKGDLKGAEAWLFEWDLPNDEVNNRMFTSVVVKDGVVLGWHEETADKWNKNSQLYKAARLDTALENLAAAQARAAYVQMASGMMANYNASRAAYDPMKYVNTSTFLYKPQPYTPIPFGGTQAPALNANQNTDGGWFAGRSKRGTTSTLVGNTMWNSDGTTSTRAGNTVWHSDGTTSTRAGNTVWHSDGTTSTKAGNTVWHSDGTTSTKAGNTVWHSDGTTTTRAGNTFWHQ